MRSIPARSKPCRESVAFGIRHGSPAKCRSIRDAGQSQLDTLPDHALAEMPKVEVAIVPTYDFWGGIGAPTI